MANPDTRGVGHDQRHKANGGQTGNKTAEHVKIARDIYNEAKRQAETKAKK